MNQITSFLHLIEAYSLATKRSEARISTLVFNNGSRIKEIRDGRDVGVRTMARATAWLSNNWPDNALWPEALDRPQPIIPTQGVSQ